MKFYMHCEVPALTVVIVWDADKQGTIQDALSIFEQSLQDKNRFPAQDTGSAEYTVSNARGKPVDLSKDVSKVVKHMDDLFVTMNVKTKLKEAENIKPSLAEATKKLNLTDGKADVEKKKSANKPQDRRNEELDGKNNAAIIHIGNERYRKAILIYKEMLQNDSRNISALKGIATCYLRAGRHKVALTYVHKALEHFPDDAELLFLAGQCYVENGKGEKAVNVLLKHCKLTRKNGGCSTEEKHAALVLLARGYLAQDQTDMAIAVLQGVLRENMEHDDALVEFATLLFTLGSTQKEEAVSTLLKILAKQGNNTYVKQKFASVCKQQEGMELLIRIADGALKDASALVFLAMCLREYSLMEESLKLFKMALKTDVKNPNAVLTYIHTLELLDNHTEIVAIYKNYLSAYPNMRVGNLTADHLRPYISALTDNLTIQNDLNLESPAQVQPFSGEYNDDERYLLALLFTLVKILFVRGLLKFIPPLLELIRPCCVGRDLHLTNIRNEAAYFRCINEMYSKVPECLTMGSTNESNFLYFISDSHCIPAAWQTIPGPYKDNAKLPDFTVYPVLSTGTKIWHLRPDSTFYPKVNFHSVVKVIPKAAMVTVCLGEIDCREAFLKCWEKARYDTIEEAMETVADIYLHVLKSLQKDNSWTIFVHPIPPVLDVTRPIVMQFNRILATKLLSEPSLHWLNFVNDLLTPDGSQLKEEYKLDGTHMHPSYLSLLTDAMSEKLNNY